MTGLPAAARTRQLPLDLAHTPGLSRDDLIASEANKAAVALIDRWPEWPAPVTVLTGPAGSGKSHMAAIWKEISGATELAAGALDEAAAGAAASGAVLIDDVGPGGVDEVGLFHLINAIRQEGGHLLLCSRLPLSEWGIALPDLSSRLKAAASVEIGTPDDVLLAGVLTKLFADRQVEVEPHVIQFLVRRMERSLSEAIGLVDALDRAALASKSRISRALAAEVFEAADRERLTVQE